MTSNRASAYSDLSVQTSVRRSDDGRRLPSLQPATFTHPKSTKLGGEALCYEGVRMNSGDAPITRLELRGLSSIEADSLADQLKGHAVEVERKETSQNLPSRKLGEPITVVTIGVVATIAAARCLALWIAKQSEKQTVEYTVDLVRTDGTREYRQLRMTHTKQTELDSGAIADVVNQITSGISGITGGANGGPPD